MPWMTSVKFYTPVSQRESNLELTVLALFTNFFYDMATVAKPNKKVLFIGDERL